jgi:hypothetical protein
VAINKRKQTVAAAAKKQKVEGPAAAITAGEEEVEIEGRFDLEAALGEAMMEEEMPPVEVPAAPGDPTDEVDSAGESDEEDPDEETPEGLGEEGGAMPAFLVESAERARAVEVVATIQSRAHATRRLVAEAWRNNREAPHNLPAIDKSISLVVMHHEDGHGTESAVSFVRWYDRKKLEARPLNLDHMNRAKFICAGWVPKINPKLLRDCDIIVQRVPMIMWKDRSVRGRDECPEWVLILRQLAKAAIHAGPWPNQGFKFGTCYVCDCRPGAVEKPPAESEVFVCSNCSACIHMACNKVLYEFLEMDMPMLHGK